MGLARTFEAAAEPAQKPARDALSALLSLGRPLVMGILNVTPDSFSDGGRFIDPAKAVAHAGIMSQQGADILDIGAESTRPYGGATPVSAEDEMARLSPVLPAVLKFGLPVSIDTIKASVAAWALDQGAGVVNDVWGLQRDPAMAPLVAERGVPVIIMHNRDSADPNIDIIAEVTAFFSRSLEIAERTGIARGNIVLDAGAKHCLHRAACRIQTLRAAAAGRRLAQALHQFGDAFLARRTPWRLDRQSSHGGEQRRVDRARA
jgi:dihydropteroate synthase